MNFLSGYKTYLAVAGLLGLAIYEFSQGNIDGAVAHIGQAIAFGGLRAAVGKVDDKTSPQ